MKVILSPAKALKTEVSKKISETTTPQFLEESAFLINKLKKMSRKKIAALMNISKDLANLNYQRYHSWQAPFKSEAALPALFIFNGEAYRALGAETLTKKQINAAQKKLRILSGLYGLLKPKDLMLPYRLEMGTRLKTSAKHTNLYHFWGDKLTNALNEEMKEGELLVNVASKEYFKALDFKKLKAQVINCHFKDNKNGLYKTIMTFAKQARGKMARFAIEYDLKKAEDLRGFSEDGYMFNQDLSTKTDFVFTRG